MRTTIRIEEDLLRAAKRRAADQGSTLTAFIEQAVRAELRREEEAERSEPLRIKPFGQGGVQPGADLYDNAALRDLMDEPG